MSRSGLVLVLLLALGSAAGCGETYIDTSLIDDGSGDVTDDTAADEQIGGGSGSATSAGDDARDFTATLEMFAFHAREISEVVVDDRERAASMLDDLEADWSLIEGIIRDEEPDRLFGFSQAVDLVRSGVERNRPADVSKGWKLLADLSADYPA